MFTPRQDGWNGGAESRKVFQTPPERTAVADVSPPDSCKKLFRVFLFCVFLRPSAGKKIFVSPNLRVSVLSGSALVDGNGKLAEKWNRAADAILRIGIMALYYAIYKSVFLFE